MIFQLRAADLAAKDKKLIGKNSSDPYYVLQARADDPEPPLTLTQTPTVT